jgi:7-cyano-7-deazaguanine synthase
MKRAVVLLSGGLDSATTLYVARARGYRVHALIFDYGQRHRREVNAAKAIARRAGAPFTLVKIVLPWKGSALLDHKIKIRSVTRSQGHKVTRKIPATYVPGRNIIFLSYALSCAEAMGASRIFIGANAVDYSGYPDFMQAFNRAARRGTKAGVTGHPIKIETPLMRWTKARIIREGMRRGVPYVLTWSCYQGGARPCGVCESCRIRAKGFFEAGIQDPASPSRQTPGHP